MEVDVRSACQEGSSSLGSWRRLNDLRSTKHVFLTVICNAPTATRASCLVEILLAIPPYYYSSCRQTIKQAALFLLGTFPTVRHTSRAACIANKCTQAAPKNSLSKRSGAWDRSTTSVSCTIR